MKNENELDDFLRSKEEEFNVPFEEKYWDKASAFIEAERGRRVIAFSVRNIVTALAVILLLAGGAYMLVTKNSSNKTGLANSTTVNSSNTNNNNNSTSVNSNSNTTNSTTTTTTTNSDVNNNTTANATTNNTVVANANNNTSAKTTTSIKGVTGRSMKHIDKTTTVANSTKSTVSSTSAKTSTTSVKSTKSVARNHVKRSTNTINDNATADNAREVANNSVGLSSNIPSLTDLTSPKPGYISYPVESNTIPVFENMNVFDKTMATLYGLPLTSEPNHPYKRVQDIDHRFPLLEVYATGGLNIFKTFDENVKNHSYINTNPFIGGKAIYRWNQKNWFVQGQLNVVQQGGINQTIPVTYLAEGVLQSSAQSMTIRHLYYIQLPVSLGYQIVSPSNKISRFTAGLGVAYLLGDGAQVKDDSTGKYVGSYKVERNSGFRHLDCFVALGYTYILNKKISFTLSAQYGLVDVTKDGYFGQSNGDHNMNIGLAVDYSLLKKKLMIK